MTDKLTDEDICRLMGWERSRVELDYVFWLPVFHGFEWIVHDEAGRIPTPDFNDERNIFKWVVPWLGAQDIQVEIEMCPDGFCTVKFRKITLDDCPYLSEGFGVGFVKPFRAALAQVKK